MASTTVVKNRELVVNQIQEPPRYKVVLINDNVTTMEFVVELLRSVFKHTKESAIDITMKIHESGSGIAGIYNFEIAEQKAVDAIELSRNNGFPLVIKVEEE
jgi:ATP-dependent Clp protease adaptor protein ClpS